MIVQIGPIKLVSSWNWSKTKKIHDCREDRKTCSLAQLDRFRGCSIPTGVRRQRFCYLY